MSVPEREGVYLLCSSDAFGNRIYKVGRSDNLRQRLGSYPPNWCLLDCLPCEKSAEMERVLIRGFRTTYKTYDRNEYFEIDADFYEIKHFFNNLMYETRISERNKPAKKERTVEEKPVAEREKKGKPEGGPVGRETAKLLEIRADQLEVFQCDTRKDVEERAEEFNKLIDVIMGVNSKPREEQKRALRDQLDNLVAKKRSKEIAETILSEGLGGVTLQMKIDKRELAARLKRHNKNE
jgi:hypothetical protein